MATGTDDDATIRANRAGFELFQLRALRLVDVRTIDMSTDILGRRWPTPIVIAPTGSNQAFHPEGELAVTRGQRETNTAGLVDRCLHIDRRRHRGERRADLVSALPEL